MVNVTRVKSWIPIQVDWAPTESFAPSRRALSPNLEPGPCKHAAQARILPDANAQNLPF